MALTASQAGDEEGTLPATSVSLTVQSVLDTICFGPQVRIAVENPQDPTCCLLHEAVSE
jgi:hypothetical protein